MDPQGMVVLFHFRLQITLLQAEMQLGRSAIIRVIKSSLAEGQ